MGSRALLPDCYGAEVAAIVLGAGVTGLAAAATLRVPLYEQAELPGGICRSYYVKPGGSEILSRAPGDEEAYRFEVGGGHWMFGGEETTMAVLARRAKLRTYSRRAVIRLGRLGKTVSYPMQANVSALGPDWEERVARDLGGVRASADDVVTMRDWLLYRFGPSLCELFFFPFNDRYTAGLTGTIMPQDDYKSPPRETPQGYNSTFCYPDGGLDRLVDSLAGECDLRYGKQLVKIDADSHELVFSDDTKAGYSHLVSTLPLHQMLQMAGVDSPVEADPYTSVLVVNIGAQRGPSCPDAHWQYEPDSESLFHRVGFYSNVDVEFLPSDRRHGATHVSLYVERGFPGGVRPDKEAAELYRASVVQELQERGYIGEVEAIDSSWVDVAYTWRLPGSDWQARGLKALADIGIFQLGRYGRWKFQGIAESIREGSMVRGILPAEAW